MSVSVFDRNSKDRVIFEVSGYDYLFEIDFMPKIYDVLHIDGEYFIVCIIAHSKNQIAVRKIRINFEPEEISDSDFICPYCGYVENDAWELSKYDNETTCSSCGAELKYSIEITTTYCVEGIKPPNLVEIN